MSHELADEYLAVIRKRNLIRATILPIVKPNGLIPEDWLVLDTLSRTNDAVTLTSLSKIMQCTYLSGLSKNVEKLVLKGLVHRHHDQIDRRAVVVTISAKGKEMVDKINSELPKESEVIKD